MSGGGFRMNVSILSETAAWGGAEVHTVGLANVLAGRGHRVSVVALGHDVFDHLSGRPDVPFRVCKLAAGRAAGRVGFGEWRGLLKGVAGDVCVLARWGLGVGSLRLDLAARLQFDRYIVIEHSSGELPPRSSRRHLGGVLPGLGLWWYRAVALWYLRSVLSTRVVCVSEATRQQMIRQFRVPAGKLVTVHDGIDTERFVPDPRFRGERRQAWGIGMEAVVFGAVSRLSHEKGLDMAIDAFARLRDRRPGREMHLVLVGEGAERTRLQEQARAAGVGGEVHFPGFTAAPWEAYCGLDFFLMPSRDEALGLSLLEAMACGCCPIATAVGGIPEVVCDPTLGWLVPRGDTAGFEEAMGAAARMGAAERAGMAIRAREHVREHFDGRRQYAALADLIERGGREAA
jgi:glycosyltransferase involved in cell wall biosynthesis